MMIIVYALAVSLLSFVLYGVDKRRAQRKCRRISESTLIFFAFIGGAVGALIGMLTFHHKTKKPLFYILIPLLSTVWTFLYIAALAQGGYI